MQASSYNSLQNKPCLPRTILTESTRTKPRHSESKGPCAPKGAGASSRVCGGEGRARTESCDEAGGCDDRLLHDEDLELLHHGHGRRFCSHSSASLSRTSPAADAGDERRRQVRAPSSDLWTWARVLCRETSTSSPFTTDLVGHDPFCYWAKARTDGRRP